MIVYKICKMNKMKTLFLVTAKFFKGDSRGIQVALTVNLSSSAIKRDVLHAVN